SRAHAQTPASDVEATTSDDAGAPPPPRVGYGAMPGGLHIATAEVMPPGTFEIAALSGYGYRKGLLDATHTFNRALGDLAFAYAPLHHLMIGLSLDGRYDKHTKVAMTPDDDNLVGNPHLLIRANAPLGRVTIAGQLGIWVPGKDAPSVDFSATSVD